MFISYVIDDFLTTVKEKLPEFNYLKNDFYDPNLEFENRIRSYLAKVDSKQLEGSEEDWIGICWTRGVIQDASELQDRSFEAVEKELQTLSGNFYKVKLAKVSFDVAYFSNSLDYIEDFEENHYLVFNKMFSNKVLLPLFGWTDVAYTELTLGGIEKLDRDEKGTVVELSFSFSAIFPVARRIPEKQDVPLIGEDIDPVTGLPNGKPRLNLQILFEIVD